MRATPLARLLFTSAGFRVLDSIDASPLRLDSATTIEHFVHHKSLAEAHSSYLASQDIAESPELIELRDHLLPSFPTLVLLLVGNKAAICPPSSADFAYQLANAANLYGTKPTPKICEAMKSAHILDVTELSCATPVVVRLLAKRFGISSSRRARLTLRQFSRIASYLCQRGLLVPPIGQANLGDFNRYAPFCPSYGFSRGIPIDRFYLDQFVRKIKEQVVGVTLEIGGNRADFERYGFCNVTEFKTMDLIPSERVDEVADAHCPNAWREDSLDSILLFNVLEHCERPWVVVNNAKRWLRKGGKIFAFVPNIQRIHRDPRDFWRILPDAFASLFESFQILDLGSYGNLLTSIAALSGLAAHELTTQDLNHVNPQYPVVTWIVAENA